MEILQKLIQDKDVRIWYAGLIIIAANAGGAWSPIGDVTTTMLWMGKKVSAGALIEYLVIPSLACMIVPTVIASFLPAFKGTFEASQDEEKINKINGRFRLFKIYFLILTNTLIFNI